MKRVALILFLLLIVACVQQPPAAQPVLVIAAVNETTSSSVTNETIAVDVNATDEPIVALNDTKEEEIVTSPQPTLSLTEQWKQEFNTRYGTYYYEINDDSRFDVLYVFRFANRTKYTGPKHLFEVQNGTVVQSQWYNTAWTPIFKEKVRDHEIPVMNYMFYENGSYTGCYVWSGYYKLFNCITDNATGEPIIYYNLSFVPPVSPLDWLETFKGVEPLKTRYNFTYKDEGYMIHMVDMVYFPYNGTSAVMYVHQSWKIPLKVEILDKDNKVIQTYKYKFITTDLSYVRRTLPFFIEE